MCRTSGLEDAASPPWDPIGDLDLARSSLVRICRTSGLSNVTIGDFGHLGEEGPLTSPAKPLLSLYRRISIAREVQVEGGREQWAENEQAPSPFRTRGHLRSVQVRGQTQNKGNLKEERRRGVAEAANEAEEGGTRKSAPRTKSGGASCTDNTGRPFLCAGAQDAVSADAGKGGQCGRQA